MRPARLPALLQALPVTLALTAGPSPALVIYRFGGEQLPPPPEATGAGVRFVQLAWTDLDPAAGGQATGLRLSREAIGSLERDPGVNIAPTIAAQGGEHLEPGKNGTVWDGDTGTAWLPRPYLCAEFATASWSKCLDSYGTPGTANLDLGGLYQIDRVRVVSGLQDPGRVVQSFAIHLSGTLPRGLGVGQPIGPYGPWVAQVRDNRLQVLDVAIPPHPEARFLQVVVGEHSDDWEVDEIEVYARGLVARSTYQSNIIAFDRPAAWGDLLWSGSQGTSRVLIQTRTGSDPSPERYFRYTGRGDETEAVSRDEYRAATVGQQAGVGYDVTHWSFWSAPYAFADGAGVPIASPGPRTHIQLKVDFVAGGDEGGRLDVLEFRASAPRVAALVGEVWPVEAPAGVWTSFTYLLRPTIEAGDPGFDRLEIRSPSLLGAVHGVRVADVAVPYSVEEAGPHRLVVGLPRLRSRDSGSLVEVEFAAQVLRYGATFEARVADSAQPLEVPQGVSGGDATGAFEGNRVSVSTAVRGQILQLRVEPGVLTPNGDGRNEQARMEYEVLEITGSASVRVEVWDLAGRCVRRLHAGAQGSGSYQRTWDGRDDDGRLLPPGLYLCRVRVATDNRQIDAAKVLHLAY